MSALPAKHVFTVHEWHHFAEVGVFTPDYRAELIEGEVIDMPPIGTSHSSCVNYLLHHLSKRLPDSLWLSVQNPLTLSDFSEPEPDLAIVHYRDDYYRNAHPGPDDVLLVIEVADSTLSYDRNTKALLYAKHGIAEYWIVDLTGQSVEVYRQPQQGKYLEQQTLRGEAVLQSEQVPAIQMPTRSLFWS